jgi:hypothetical protein
VLEVPRYDRTRAAHCGRGYVRCVVERACTEDSRSEVSVAQAPNFVRDLNTPDMRLGARLGALARGPERARAHARRAR